MASCKECLHVDVCEALELGYGIKKVHPIQCGYFKPTADVEEVVRCKDCTEWDEKECECSHWYGFRENDFCSHGVRRSEE